MKLTLFALMLVLSSTAFAQVFDGGNCLKTKAKNFRRIELSFRNTDDDKFQFVINNFTIDGSRHRFDVGQPSVNYIPNSNNYPAQMKQLDKKVNELSQRYALMRQLNPEAEVVVALTKSCFDRLTLDLKLAGTDTTNLSGRNLQALNEANARNNDLQKEISSLKAEIEQLKKDQQAAKDSNVLLSAELKARGESFEKMLSDNASCHNDKANILATCLSISTQGSKSELRDNIEAVRRALATQQ